MLKQVASLAKESKRDLTFTQMRHQRNIKQLEIIKTKKEY